MSIKKIDAFKSLFYPESIAIIGASSKDGKVGNLAIKSIISSSYKGKVHLVNPKLNGHLYGWKKN